MARRSSSSVTYRSRRGAVAVLAAILMVVLIGMVAFAIDCGMIVLARTQLQAAADAGALAGVCAVQDGNAAAKTAAQTFAQSNTAGGRTVSVTPASDIQIGTWNNSTSTFTATTTNVNAVRMTCTMSSARGNPLNLFFARVFGRTTSDLSASATATVIVFNCGPFVGLNSVSITGGSYTDSYNSTGATASGNMGDVCSNGAISLSGNSTVVHGDAHPGVSGSISMSGGSSVSGSTTQLQQALSEPAVNPGTAATSNDNHSIPATTKGRAAVDGSGNFTLSGGESVTLPAGTYYFTTMTITGGATINLGNSGKTIIYCAGDVHISGGSLLNSSAVPANCQLFCMGSSVALSGGSQFYGVVYAPAADITRNGATCDFYGMMVGKSLTLSGGSGLHYDESLNGMIGSQSSGRLVQ
jgi:Flp pilus assembly protein TadG